jgi:hypothetical protein
MAKWKPPVTSEVSPPMVPSTLWELLVHIVIGIIIFGAIALPAVGLDFLVVWLSSKGVSTPIIWGLEFAEYFLYLVDLILLVVFVWKTAVRIGKRF